MVNKPTSETDMHAFIIPEQYQLSLTYELSILLALESLLDVFWAMDFLLNGVCKY